MVLRCDDNAAIKCTEIQGAIGLRYKIEVEYHIVKKCVNRRRIELEWVASKQQLTDIFTQPMSFTIHELTTKWIFNNDNQIVDPQNLWYPASGYSVNVGHTQRDNQGKYLYEEVNGIAWATD